MKNEIHPQYYPEAKVTCACGAEFTVGSTLPEIQVGICSNCHPFYTGQEKLVDTEGRVERFVRQRGEAEQKTEIASKRTQKRLKEQAQKERETQDRPKTLREMVERVKKEQG